MPTRTNSLRDAMLGVQASPTQPVALSVVPTPESSVTNRQPVAPSRIGKRAISGHFDPAVGRQLRILAAEKDRSTEDLLGEALNDLFRKYNKSAIAE